MQIGHLPTDAYILCNLKISQDDGTMAAYDHASTRNSTVTGIESINGRTIGRDVKVVDPHAGKVGNLLTLDIADGSFRPDAIKFDHFGSPMHVTNIGVIQERTITFNGSALPSETTCMYPNIGVIGKIIHDNSSSTNIKLGTSSSNDNNDNNSNNNNKIDFRNI